MLNFLRLIRIQNLLMVALTQLAMRYMIINPMLMVNNFELQFSNLYFALLVIATMLLTAAGYIINDYFDRKTDLLNKPDKVVVGKFISRRMSMALHISFNIIGVALGFYISYAIGIYKLGFIFVIISGVLWYYSTTYKRQFLIGNIIVALLTALVPLMVVVYEIPLLNRAYGQALTTYGANFNVLFYWIAAFSFFAFIVTLIREIIKDMEDLEGDDAYGRNTLPVVIGINTSKTVVISLILITIAMLIITEIRFLDLEISSLIYFALFLVIPFVLLMFWIMKADNKNNYHRASILTKVIMLSGVLYSSVIWYYLTWNV